MTYVNRKVYLKKISLFVNACLDRHARAVDKAAHHLNALPLIQA